MKPSFVYVILAKDYVKVGMTKNMEVRLATIGSGLPFEAEIYAFAEFSEKNITRHVERETHNSLKKKNLHARGEWFNGGRGHGKNSKENPRHLCR